MRGTDTALTRTYVNGRGRLKQQYSNRRHRETDTCTNYFSQNGTRVETTKPKAWKLERIIKECFNKVKEKVGYYAVRSHKKHVLNSRLRIWIEYIEYTEADKNNGKKNTGKTYRNSWKLFYSSIERYVFYSLKLSFLLIVRTNNLKTNVSKRTKKKWLCIVAYTSGHNWKRNNKWSRLIGCFNVTKHTRMYHLKLSD